MKQKKTAGADLFEKYYSEIYLERWERLKASLLLEKEPVSLSNALLTPYYMDAASIIASSVLAERISAQLSKRNTQNEDSFKVLDMCAAPGGKTLVLALKLMEYQTKLNLDWTLIANDRSADRRARLAAVLKNSLPEKVCERIKTTGHDATRWGLYEKNTYDAILLDAPCSSERHVIQDEKALSQWSLHRPKELAIRQYAMLSAAFDAVKDGGYILYSTCSINPEENTEVIKKLFKRKDGMVEEIKHNEESGKTRPCDTGSAVNAKPDDIVCFTEKLEKGNIILPDRSGGFGPIYFCLLRKMV